MSVEKTIVVTGANGFIGKHLCAFLKSSTNHKVIGLTRSDVNLMDASATADKLRDISPDYVFHLAATGVSHERANDPTVIDENVSILTNVAEGCTPRTTLVVAGSMSEYGGSGTFSEDDPCTPKTAYGQSKLAVTKRACEIADANGLKVCVVRLFGVYGSGENANRLFPSLLRELRADRVVQLSDGLQSRDFIHVKDVCEFLWLLAKKLDGHSPLVVNLGTGQAVSIKNVCQWIAAELSKPAELLGFGLRVRSPGDADIMCANVETLHNILGQTPPQRLRSGVTVKDLFD